VFDPSWQHQIRGCGLPGTADGTRSDRASLGSSILPSRTNSSVYAKQVKRPHSKRGVSRFDFSHGHQICGHDGTLDMGDFKSPGRKVMQVGVLLPVPRETGQPGGCRGRASTEPVCSASRPAVTGINSRSLRLDGQRQCGPTNRHDPVFDSLREYASLAQQQSTSLDTRGAAGAAPARRTNNVLLAQRQSAVLIRLRSGVQLTEGTPKGDGNARRRYVLALPSRPQADAIEASEDSPRPPNRPDRIVRGSADERWK
jgi:hypothetical protein